MLRYFLLLLLSLSALAATPNPKREVGDELERIERAIREKQPYDANWIPRLQTLATWRDDSSVPSGVRVLDTQRRSAASLVRHLAAQDASASLNALERIATAGSPAIQAHARRLSDGYFGEVKKELLNPALESADFHAFSILQEQAPRNPTARAALEEISDRAASPQVWKVAKEALKELAQAGLAVTQSEPSALQLLFDRAVQPAESYTAAMIADLQHAVHNAGFSLETRRQALRYLSEGSIYHPEARAALEEIAANSKTPTLGFQSKNALAALKPVAPIQSLTPPPTGPTEQTLKDIVLNRMPGSTSIEKRERALTQLIQAAGFNPAAREALEEITQADVIGYIKRAALQGLSQAQGMISTDNLLLAGAVREAGSNESARGLTAALLKAPRSTLRESLSPEDLQRLRAIALHAHQPPTFSVRTRKLAVNFILRAAAYDPAAEAILKEIGKSADDGMRKAAKDSLALLKRGRGAVTASLEKAATYSNVSDLYGAYVSAQKNRLQPSQILKLKEMALATPKSHDIRDIMAAVAILEQSSHHNPLALEALREVAASAQDFYTRSLATSLIGPAQEGFLPSAELQACLQRFSRPRPAGPVGPHSGQ